MKCLFAYKWVKLRRDHLPSGKGIMGAWMRLAARAAFRSGSAQYCGYTNEVTVGSWVGGIVGLKSILGVRDRKQALAIMDTLSTLGYVEYSLDAKSKKLSYHITDWIMECTGETCLNGAVYATEGYGFLCTPRSITQRLVDRNYTFEEADAWLDLWTHTIWQDQRNVFSRLTPAIQFVSDSPILTLEALGKRWKWEKTKVWRFLQKYNDTFSLVKLPGAYGCLIFNTQYSISFANTIPAPEYGKIVLILDKIRIWGRNTHFAGTDNRRIGLMVAKYSPNLTVCDLNEGLPSPMHPAMKSRVAVSRAYNIRAYFSYPLQHNSSSYHQRIDWPGIDIDAASTELITRPGKPPGLLFCKEDQNVRHNTEAVREAGESAVYTVGRIHEIPREKGSYQRCEHPERGDSESQAGTTTDHVSQYRAAVEALSKHQMGVGMLSGHCCGGSRNALSEYRRALRHDYNADSHGQHETAISLGEPASLQTIGRQAERSSDSAQEKTGRW